MKAIITGGSSGLGAAIARELDEKGWAVDDWSLTSDVDVTDKHSTAFAATRHAPESVDLLINCAGVNFIDWHEETPIEEWDRLMNTNARSIWLVTKQLIKLGIFKKPATVINIVSNASHMPMTNSAAYNASKGAAHILTLQMARELRKRHGLTVFGISPNKMHSTEMSSYIESRVCDLRGWTPEQARDYQLNALPAGEETDPEVVAEFIAFLVSSRRRHKFLHGTIIPYGA